MTEEIAKAVNLSPGLMHNKGTGQGSPFVVHTPWTVKMLTFIENILIEGCYLTRHAPVCDFTVYNLQY